MKKEFLDYFREIELNEELKPRIEEIYNFYNELFPNIIEDVFITNRKNGENQNKFENLWFFSKSYCFEAKFFKNRDQFDATTFNKVIYWEISKSDYDFEKAITKSMLTITGYFDHDRFGFMLEANGHNCDFLKKIFRKYLLEKGSKFQ